MQWHHSINIVNEWNIAKAGGSIHDLAAVIAKKLDELDPIENELLEEEKFDIIAEFEAIAKYREEFDVEDFDSSMEMLYNWADSEYKNGKLCWIDKWTKFTTASTTP